MNKTANKTQNRNRRRQRIRARVIGTSLRPRLMVFKSNTALYAQLIDDERAVTIAAVDSRKGTQTKGDATARERAMALGGALGSKAKEKGIERVVFDRGGFRYQGIIAAFADGARASGLVF